MSEALVALVTAAALGGIIGWERETWQKPAGLRTHMMVALGAAAFTLLAMRTVGESSDPGRIVVGIATGIGFLGAGTIIQARGEVRGITTAAGIWVVGAVGACCGAGEFGIGVVAVALSVVILTLLPRLEPGGKAPGAGKDPEP